MAKHTFIKLIDDIDGTDADETIRFALDGVQYELELSERNADKLREVLSPYAAAGRKVGRTPLRVVHSTSRRSTTSEPPTANAKRSRA